MTKVKKVFLRAMLGLIILLVLLFFTLRIPSVQNYIARKVAKSLSERLNAEVTIDGMYFTPFSKVVLKNILIKDQKKDTLIFAKEIKATIKNYNLDELKFYIGSTTLDNAVVNFGTHKNDSVNNYDFFIRFFKSKDTTSNKPHKSTLLDFSKVKLINSKFRYFNDNIVAPDYARFNPSDLVFSNINASVQNLVIIDDSLSFKIKSLSCKEKSGLELNKSSCDGIVSATTLSFDNLYFETANSILRDKIEFKYNHYSDMGDFINKAYMLADMKKSKVAWSDLRFFHNNVPDKSGFMTISGKVTGPISNLRSDKILIKTLNTELRGDMILSGLPSTNTMFFDVGLKKFKTNALDLKNILGINSLPEEAKTLGNMNYVGRITGFLRDFVTYGNLYSELGIVKSDLNLKFTKNFDKATYSGDISSENFDLGKYLGNSSIGKIVLNTQLEGKGMTQRDFLLKLNGDINSLELNGSRIENLNVNGVLANNQFKGKAVSTSAGLKLDFDGFIDFSGKKPILNGKGIIRDFKLSSLGLDTSVITSVSMGYNLNFKGTDVKTTTGNLSLNNIKLFKDKTEFKLDSLFLSSSFNKDNHILKLKSDWINSTINGEIDPAKIIEAYKYVLNSKLPSLIESTQEIEDQNFSFTGEILKPKPLFALFNLPMGKRPIIFNGGLNTYVQTLDLKVKTDSINIEEYEGSNFTFNALTDEDGKIKLRSHLDDILIGDMNVNSKNIELNGIIFNDNIAYNFGFGEYKSDLTGFLVGQLNIEKNKIKAVFDPSVLMIKQQAWNIGVKSAFIYQNNDFVLDSFIFFRNDQSILLDGIFSKDKKDWITIKANKFELYTLTPLLLDSNNLLKGELTGELKVQLVNKVPNIMGEAIVKDMAYNNDTLGNVNISSKLSNRDGMLKLDANITQGFLEGLNLRGTTQLTSSGKTNLNLTIQIPKTDAKILNKQFKGLFSDVKGDIYGRLYLKGDANEPNIQGKIYAENIGLTVDFLQTKMYFSTAATINNNNILFNRTKVSDGDTGIGFFSGNISHKMFDDFNLNLKIDDIVNFRALNTKEKDNNLFYGLAYIDGNFAINGPLSGLNILLNAKSREKTDLNLPLADNVQSGPAPYIQFVNKDKNSKSKKTSEGMDFINNLELNMDVNDDAQVRLIFDETVGDVIKGRGNGQLRITMDKSAEFRMFGNYIIYEGDYLFTAFYNLINKKFSIKPGGKISWTGDPYHAQLDLVAIYNQKTSPKVLMSNTTEDETYAPIDVQSNILIKGDLMSPKIDFDLEFPNLSQNTGGISNNNLQSVLKRIKTDKEELNKQVFSLIVFGSFIKPSFSESNGISNNLGTEALNTSAGDLIGSQLSNWLSQVMPGLEVNLQVQGISVEQRQKIVASIAKRFLKDRLLIGGSFDADAASPDIKIEYDITADGKIRLKLFKKTQIDYNYQNNVETYGIGVSYKKEFDYIRKRKKKKTIVKKK